MTFKPYRTLAVMAASSLVLAVSGMAAVDYAADGKRWWSHIQFLADDKLEGRNVGTPGFEKAAIYVADQFKDLGLQPAGTDGFFQPVKFRTRKIVEEKSSLNLVEDGKVTPLKLGEDAYFSMRIEPDKHAEAEAVFVGYGLRIPEIGYDDLKGINLKGKVAVYLAGAPQNAPGPLAAHYRSSTEFWKVLKAAGAVGTASFGNPKSMDIPWSRASLARFSVAMSLADAGSEETSGQKIGITINTDHADKFLAGTGHTAAEILALADANKPLPKFPLKVKIQANPEYVVGTADSKNVAAMLPGSDPKLKSEYIVMTAHLDHLGVGEPINGDKIYNGAMDNASGIASLIETARALTEGPKLKRSMLFIAVTGEEKGLLGSQYFAAHPTVAKSSIVANMNTDMFLPIIPLHRLTVYGLDESDLGATMKRVAGKFDVEVQADPEPQRNVFIRSDQYNFIKIGVPALSMKFGAKLGTPEAKVLGDWLHQRYHAPSDDVNQPVDKEGAARFNRIVAAFMTEIANAPDKPHWYQNSFFRRYAQP